MKNSKNINSIVAEGRKFKHLDGITYSWSVFCSDRPFRRAKPIFINGK